MVQQRPAVVYAPVPKRQWWNPPAPTQCVIYAACAHKRVMQTASEEAAFVSFGPEGERIYCPGCRRKRFARA